MKKVLATKSFETFLCHPQMLPSADVPRFLRQKYIMIKEKMSIFSLFFDVNILEMEGRQKQITQKFKIDIT